MQGMPHPTDNHRRLHRLAGTWVGAEQLEGSPSDAGSTAVGRFSMWVGIDGLFVLQDYLEEKDGRVVYRGHGVFGWDGPRSSYTWYWVDSMGGVPTAPARGQWEGDKLAFENTPVGNQRGRYTYTFLSPDSFHFQIESSQDGGKTFQTFMQGTYKRT